MFWCDFMLNYNLSPKFGHLTFLCGQQQRQIIREINYTFLETIWAAKLAYIAFLMDYFIGFIHVYLQRTAFFLQKYKEAEITTMLVIGKAPRVIRKTMVCTIKVVH